MLNDPHLIRLFHAVYDDFTRWEKNQPDGACENPHVRGAQLAHYISSNRNTYRKLLEMANPDFCEQILHELESGVYPDPEARHLIDEQLRKAQVLTAYEKFCAYCKESHLIMLHDQQITAFRDYVETHFERELPGFTWEEAEKTIYDMQREKNTKVGATIIVGMLATAIIAFCGFLYVNSKAAKPDPRNINDPLHPGLKFDDRGNAPWRQQLQKNRIDDGRNKGKSGQP